MQTLYTTNNFTMSLTYGKERILNDVYIIYTNYNTFDLITFHLSYPEDRVDHSRSISALGPVCPLGRGQTSLSCPTCSKPPMLSIK